MNLTYYQSLALQLMAELEPHCERIEIAGSIRRQRANPGDIELVAIPKPYGTGLFASGVAQVLGKYEKVKGEFPCKYTQRLIPAPWGGTVKLDFFTASEFNWGYIMAIRTGSAEFAMRMAIRWTARGYRGHEGLLYNSDGNAVAVPDEETLFRICGMDYVSPEKREK